MTAATKDTRLKGATRWSLTARCERMAYYAFIGVDPKEPDDATQRMFERGQLDERWYIERLRKQHGRRNIRTQKAVPWPRGGLPLGELHQDAFIVPLAQPLEVKSHLSGPASTHDVIQTGGELYFDDEAGDMASLVVIDRNLNEHIFTVSISDDQQQPVVRDGRHFSVSRAELDRRVDALLNGIVNESEPERVCRKPSDGRAHLCPFVEHCFAGWQPPPRPRIDTTEIIELARQLYEVDLVEKQLKGNAADGAFIADALTEAGVDAAVDRLREARTLKGVELLRNEIKERLTEAIGHEPLDFEDDPGEYDVGPLVLTRKTVERREYTVAATSYETLSVKRVSTAPLLSADSFGDEAPWTDADLEGFPR